MIPLYPFNWPLFSWRRKSYMDLITQDPILQCGVFFLQEKVYHKEFKRLFWICWTMRNIPGAEPLNDIAWGTMMSPSQLKHCYGLCWFACPAMGQWWAGMLFLAALNGWQFLGAELQLPWAEHVAQLLCLYAQGYGKGRSQPVSPHLQCSAITAPHLSNDTAVGL